MDARIRREALKAAAKVALSVTALAGTALVGCAGQSKGGGDTPTEDELRAEPLTAAQCEEKLTSLDQEDDGGKHLPRTTAAQTCCKTVLRAMWGGAVEEDFGQQRAADDDGGADAEPEAGPEPILTKHRIACCSVLAPEGQKWWTAREAACSPWGPPMPPSMDHDFDMVA